MTSIRRWLLGWLIFGLAAASLVAGYGIFHTAREEASELFDYELRAVALSLPGNLVGRAVKTLLTIWFSRSPLAAPLTRQAQLFRVLARG